jgi:hypothetical protein
VSPAEEDLDGGIANAGRVVRVGKHVLRPPTAHTRSIHAYLRAVRDAGFDGVPEPVGIDDDGRERLEFVEGDVPPYPDWSQSDAALASVARLLRGLHDAARGFDASGSAWNDSLVDPAGGTLVECESRALRGCAPMTRRPEEVTRSVSPRQPAPAPGRPVQSTARSA